MLTKPHFILNALQISPTALLSPMTGFVKARLSGCGRGASDVALVFEPGGTLQALSYSGGQRPASSILPAPQWLLCEEDGSPRSILFTPLTRSSECKAKTFLSPQRTPTSRHVSHTDKSHCIWKFKPVSAALAK